MQSGHFIYLYSLQNVCNVTINYMLSMVQSLLTEQTQKEHGWIFWFHVSRFSFFVVSSSLSSSCLCQSDCGRLAMLQWTAGTAALPHMLSHIPVVSKNQRNRARCDYTCWRPFYPGNYAPCVHKGSVLLQWFTH